MPVELIAILVLAVILLIVIISNVHIVQQSRAYVIERLGAFSKSPRPSRSCATARPGSFSATCTCEEGCSSSEASWARCWTGCARWT